MPHHPDNVRAVNLLAFQDAAFCVAFRICFFMWRRQGGKSYTIASKAIDRMIEKPWRNCFFVSASIATGKEIVEKEATIWHDALGALKLIWMSAEDAVLSVVGSPGVEGYLEGNTVVVAASSSVSRMAAQSSGLNGMRWLAIDKRAFGACSKPF